MSSSLTYTLMNFRSFPSPSFKFVASAGYFVSISLNSVCKFEASEAKLFCPSVCRANAVGNTTFTLNEHLLPVPTPTLPPARAPRSPAHRQSAECTHQNPPTADVPAQLSRIAPAAHPSFSIHCP